MFIANTSGKSLYNVHNARDYYDPFKSFANGINYVFAGKQTDWDNNQNPPIPDQSLYNLEYQIFDDMIFGKLITQDNISIMINNYQWASGTIYDMYDDTDTELYQKKFYVVSPQNGNYYVFKCLNNNLGAKSTYPPLFSFTSASDPFYQAADGYVWKYMFTIPSSVWSTFATVDYAPVLPDANVKINAVDGAIESIKINYGGNNFFSFANGQFQQFGVYSNSQYYAIDNSLSLQLYLSSVSGTFLIGETVSQGNSTGIVALANTSFLQLNEINGSFTLGGIIGQTSTATANVVTVATAGSAANSGFYNNCSIYIQSGTGVGQVRNIIDYIIVGTLRVVVLDSPFSTTPDATSHYYIGPRVNITGDGTGAIAIAQVNASTFSISDVPIINIGSGYSYANVNITANTVTYGPGAQFYSLILSDTSGTFQVGEIVAQNTFATGEVQSVNNNVIRLTGITGSFLTNYSEFGLSNTSGTLQQNEVVFQSSATANVYGSVVSVNTSYIVIKNINGGEFSISGNVIRGQTSNASASLSYSSTIRGQTSNATGTLIGISSSSANVQAIISPKGGHGYDVYSELFANKVGVSVQFANTESNTIPAYGIGGNTEYHQIGILSQPLLANVQLTLSNTSGTFLTGETVFQYKTANVVDSVFTANVINYSYTIGKYQKLSFNAVPNFAVNDVISQNSSVYGVVISNSGIGNAVIVRTDSGAFSNSANVIKSSNSSVNNFINSISQGFTNTVFGNDSSNNLLVINTVSNFVQVYLNNQLVPDFSTLLSNTTLLSESANSTAISFKNYTFTNTDIVKIKLLVQNAIFSNSEYQAQGIVTFSNSTVVYLTNVNNIFVTSANLYGVSSGFTANIASLITPSTTYNQTTRIIGQYQSSNTFAVNDFVKQIDQLSGVTLASGYVQGIANGSNSSTYSISLNNVKGVFQPTSNISNKYISTNTSSLLVTGVTNPDLIPYSGNILYVENIIPVMRSNTQSETTKIVLEFY